MEPLFRSGLVCKYCNKVYYTQQNFDLHVAGHEGDDKGFRWCLICGLKLRYHQHKYHMKKHQGPANCYDCDRTYNNVEILRRHIKVRRAAISPFYVLPRIFIRGSVRRALGHAYLIKREDRYL